MGSLYLFVPAGITRVLVPPSEESVDTAHDDRGRQ